MWSVLWQHILITVKIFCHNTDHAHVNGHDRTIFVILTKYCTRHKLCISWIIKSLYVTDARCKHEES